MRSSFCGSVEMSLTSIHEDTSSIPGLTQGVEDLTLHELWYRPAAVDMIHPLAWEPPYTMDGALKTKKKKKKKKKKNNGVCKISISCKNLSLLAKESLLTRTITDGKE